MSEAPVALVTGAARRIGAGIAVGLHTQGYRVILHCHRSHGRAERLACRLRARRPDSAATIRADLRVPAQVDALATATLARYGRLDALVNNASTFYPTPWERIDRQAWRDMLESQLLAPFFLCQALSKALAECRGSIVNITDIYAQHPLRDHLPYCVTKSGLEMLTRAAALELAPAVRVNAVAPGSILWPVSEAPVAELVAQRRSVLDSVPLRRQGRRAEIVRMVAFLLKGDHGLNGQVVTVDGGRALSLG